jgi:gliding motility-associated lipoprotein GldH
MKKYLLSAFVMLGVLLSSCNNNRIFEENKDFENNAWPISAIQEFKFEVKDTSKKYAIYFNVRNAVSYEYYNLYLKHILIGPDGKEISTNLHELFLMDKQTGKPLGDGAGDIFDHQVLAIKDQTFAKPGIYTIRLQQYMRRDPLPGIMAVGVRVETQE